jgi:hypothetical protein
MIRWATNMIGVATNTMISTDKIGILRRLQNLSIMNLKSEIDGINIITGLALWKARTSSLDNGKAMNGGNEKMNIDQSAFKSSHYLPWAFIWVPVAAFHETIHSRPIAL